MNNLTRSNSLADLAARIRAAVDTKLCSLETFGNDANGGVDVVTKVPSCEQFGNDGVGFIRVRKRKLKALASSSMSFDLVRARRANGKPRHEFVLGLGSQKDADRDWALCWFWARPFAA